MLKLTNHIQSLCKHKPTMHVLRQYKHIPGSHRGKQQPQLIVLLQNIFINLGIYYDHVYFNELPCCTGKTSTWAGNIDALKRLFRMNAWTREGSYLKLVTKHYCTAFNSHTQIHPQQWHIYNKDKDAGLNGQRSHYSSIL